MFSNFAIDLVVGLIFIFALYSLLATVIQEFFVRIFSLRAIMLVKAVRLMLDGRPKHDISAKKYPLLHIVPSAIIRWAIATYESICHLRCSLPPGHLSRAFYEHPSIKYQSESIFSNKPSYLSAETFAATLIDLLRVNYDGTGSQIAAIRDRLFPNNVISIDGADVIIKDEPLKQLRRFHIDAANDIDKFRARLEFWYRDTMDRTTGWYKRQTQLMLFVIGLGLAMLFNADVLAISQILASSKVAREQLANMAVANAPKYAREGPMPADSGALQYLATTTDSALLNSYKQALADVKSVNQSLGLGWNRRSADAIDSARCAFMHRLDGLALADSARAQIRAIMEKERGTAGGSALELPQQDLSRAWIGWLLMAFAVCLGSTFWFDLLAKVVQLRAAGSRPQDKVDGQAAGAGNQPSQNPSSQPQRVG